MQLDASSSQYRISVESASQVAARVQTVVDAAANCEAQNDTLSALEHCQAALRESANHLNALLKMGGIALRREWFDLAQMYYERALKQQPNCASIWLNLSYVYQRQNMEAKELDCLRAAHRFGLQSGDAARRMGHLYYRIRQFPDALAAFLRALHVGQLDCLRFVIFLSSELLSWDMRPYLQEIIDGIFDDGSDFPKLCPFDLLTYTVSRTRLRWLANQFARDRYPTLRAPALVEKIPHAMLASNGLLRVGYLTADLDDHATMFLFKDVLSAHDPNRFQIFFYSTRTLVKPTWVQWVQSHGTFVDVSQMTDAQAADRIVSDQVNILVDMKGFTKDERLGICALRPAPVIVSWLGYPGTLGHNRLADYIIGDPVVTPIAHADGYSEFIAQMPLCYQPNSSRFSVHSPALNRQSEGLPADSIVFCSFNNLNKLTPELFELWCTILAAVPNSVLWLYDRSSELARTVRQFALTNCIAPERFIFASHLPHAEHLARIALADIALDPFPCNSHTTGSDILWAGVPMISLIGETFASRVGASLLLALNLHELVVSTQEAYAELAIRLAMDPAYLRDVRTRLHDAAAASALFDIQKFTADLEFLYLKIWQNTCNGTHAPILAT